MPSRLLGMYGMGSKNPFNAKYKSHSIQNELISIAQARIIHEAMEAVASGPRFLPALKTGIIDRPEGNITQYYYSRSPNFINCLHPKCSLIRACHSGRYRSGNNLCGQGRPKTRVGRFCPLGQNLVVLTRLKPSCPKPLGWTKLDKTSKFNSYSSLTGSLEPSVNYC